MNDTGIIHVRHENGYTILTDGDWSKLEKWVKAQGGKILTGAEALRIDTPKTKKPRRGILAESRRKAGND